MLVGVVLTLAGLSTPVFAQIDQAYFDKLRTENVTSSDEVIWKNFGPGMSGYNEEYWCHPTDLDVMFMAPDMHNAYGTWDGGVSWQTLKDYDGDGWDMERVTDIQFSLVNPDFGVAIERRGQVMITNDRGRSWSRIYQIPQAATSPWYNSHSRIALHPTNDNIWYIGAGGFWDVKGQHRSAANPAGTHRPIYAYGYILKTTDGGNTWNKIATEIDPMLDIGKIRINPNNPDSIVIATAQGMFASPDAGATWNDASIGLPNNLPKDLSDYYDESTKDYTLYTVEQSIYTKSGNSIATKGGVYKSTDGGKSWTSITGNLGLNMQAISEQGFRNNYQNAVAYWLGTNKSEINALDYPSNTLQVFRRIEVDPTNKNVIYLHPNQRHDRNFGPGDLWKTEDGGQTWKIVTKHGTYWIEGKDQSYWSSKGMTTTPNVEFAHLQASLDEELETSSANRHLTVNSNGDVFIGINQQTHRSTDGGDSWQQVDSYETAPGTNAWIGSGNSNLPGRFMLHETGIPDRKLFCTGEHGLWESASIEDWPDRDAVAVSQIEGQVHNINGGKSMHSVSTVAVHPDDPNTIFILGWRQSHRGKVRKSTDGGKTWENIATLFDANNATHETVASQYSLLIDPEEPQNMYFTAILKSISCGTNSGPGPELTLGEYGVHKSTDGGFTWSVQNEGLPAGASVNRIVMDPKNTKVLYATLNQWTNSDSYGLYKSTDQTETWTEMTIPAAIRSVNNLFIDPNTDYMYISCGARSGALNAGGVYRSKDQGDTWELIFDAPYVWQAETSKVNPEMILMTVASQSGTRRFDHKNPGVYLSRDDGASWIKINKGIAHPDKMVDVELDPYNENILWAAGWGSGWYKGMIQTDEVEARADDAEADENSEVTLYAMGSIGTQLSYEWTAPEGIELLDNTNYKAKFTAPLVEQSEEFIFTLTVSNENGSDTKEVTVTVNDIGAVLSAGEISRNELLIYPNPISKGYVEISGLSSVEAYRIYKINGSLVGFGEPIKQRIDVSGLPQGLYFLELQSEGQLYKKKILVE